MNRIDQLFEQKNKTFMSVYFTAGYPKLNDTLPVLEALQKTASTSWKLAYPLAIRWLTGRSSSRRVHKHCVTASA